MTNLDPTTPASVTQQGAPVAPVEASSKKQASARNHSPKPRKPTKGAKPEKNATTKSAKVMALLARTNGASLAELMKETQWQAHSGHSRPMVVISSASNVLSDQATDGL
jgi:hypothetical protein